MANIRTFTSYVRDQQGNGIGDALVQAYAITNIDLNEKGVSPIAETYPDGTTGRYSLAVDLDLSSTGYVSFKISRGSTVRWIEGDVVMQATNFMGPNGEIPLPASSITDAHLGNRTVDQTLVPTGHTSTLTGLFSRLANRIRAITGEGNWYTAPVQTLRQLNDKFSGSTTTGHDHSGVAGEGPRLVPESALTWTPATADHLHDDRYALKDETSSGGGDGGTADDSLELRGVDGRKFIYMYDESLGYTSTFTGPHRTQFGTTVVTTNSQGSANISYPSGFPNRTVWIHAVNGDTNAYRGAIGPTGSTRTGFTIRLATNEARQVRVNWMAIGN